MYFTYEDIFLVIKTLTDEQRQAIIDAADDQEKFWQVFSELGLIYWRTLLQYVKDDIPRICKAVCKTVLSDQYKNRQLGISLETLLFRYLKNNSAWLDWLREKGCNMHPNAVEVVLFNGLSSGEFDRFIDTFKLLGSGKAHVVYRERVCPNYDSTCLFCENGVQYFPAGTVYDNLEEK